VREGWKKATLGTVCDIQSGAGFPENLQGGIDQRYPFYKVSDMNLPGNKTTMLSANNSVSEVVRKQLGARVFTPGSIIFPKVGGAISTNKKRKTSVECCVDNNVMGLIPKEKYIDPDYLFYVMQNIDIFDFSNKANLPSIRQTTVDAWQICLPESILEQKRIVTILDEAFEGISTAVTSAEKNLANARELFNSYLNSVFAQRGEGWVEKRLGDLIDIAHGYAFDGSDFQTSTDSEKPIVLTPGNYTEHAELSFTPKNTKRFNGSPPAAYLFDPGNLTIVMTDLSSKMKILGKPAFVTQPNVLHNQRIGRILEKSDSVTLGYIYYFFRADSVSEEIKKTSTGTMVRHTAPKRILSITMPFPKKISHQERLTTFISELS